MTPIVAGHLRMISSTGMFGSIVGGFMLIRLLETQSLAPVDRRTLSGRKQLQELLRCRSTHVRRNARIAMLL